MSTIVTLNQTQVRMIPWGTSSLWHVSLAVESNKSLAVPNPFDSWFPATNLTLNETGTALYQVNLFDKTYSFPQASEDTTLSMNGIDDENETLYTWFKNWHSLINGSSNKRPLTLTDSVMRINFCGLQRVNGSSTQFQKSLVERSYLILPSSGIAWDRTSEASNVSYNFEFKIVGD